MPKKITPLQLFKQNQKIDELRSKLYQEERKLYDMIEKAPGYNELLLVNGNVYKIVTKKTWNSYNNRLQVEKIESAEVLAGVIK